MSEILRLARPADIEFLLPFMAEYCAFDGLHYDPDRAQRTMLALLEDARLGRTWFIEAEGQTCGYVALCYGYSLELGGRDGFIDELYIRDAFRGRGLGTRALEAACRAAQAEGICALYLEVRQDNIEAQRYYGRLGFERRDRYFLLARRLQGTRSR
jgi:ribosomal protein S18 acetylase RimI-like enzyme